MMKFAVLLALVAAASAQFGYSYSAVTPYAYPYSYAGYPYASIGYSAYAPITKSIVAAPAVAATPYVAAPAVAATPYVAAPYVAAPVVAAPALVKTQYHAQDPMTGSASYGHIEAGQAHQAIQDAAGNKIGSFSHVLPDGSVSRTDYVADAMGYRVASNSLPINAAAVPTPVADTPEVVAARAAHFAEVEAVKSRSKRAIAYTAVSPVAYSAGYAASPVAYTAGYAAAPVAYKAYTAGYAAPAYAGYYGSPFAYSKLPYYY